MVALIKVDHMKIECITEFSRFFCKGLAQGIMCCINAFHHLLNLLLRLPPQGAGVGAAITMPVRRQDWVLLLHCMCFVLMPYVCQLVQARYPQQGISTKHVLDMQGADARSLMADNVAELLAASSWGASR